MYHCVTGQLNPRGLTGMKRVELENETGSKLHRNSKSISRLC